MHLNIVNGNIFDTSQDAFRTYGNLGHLHDLMQFQDVVQAVKQQRLVKMSEKWKSLPLVSCIT